MTRPGLILVLACGNRMAGDDAVGLYVADELRRRRLSTIELLVDGSDAAELMHRIDQRSILVVVDAIVDPMGWPGQIVDCDWFSPQRPPLAHERRLSSHAWSVEQQIELAQALGALPPRVRLLGVNIARSVRYGEPLSAPVVAAVAPIVCRLSDLAAEFSGRESLAQEALNIPGVYSGSLRAVCDGSGEGQLQHPL